MVVRPAFEAMGPHRVDLRVLETNIRAVRCYKRCGFIHEGVEAETAFAEGPWGSDLRMRLLVAEYQRLAGEDAPPAR